MLSAGVFPERQSPFHQGLVGNGRFTLSPEKQLTVKEKFSLFFQKSGTRLKVCKCGTEEGNFLTGLLGERS